MQRAKQIILIRKDLKMKPGKVAVQVAHASLGAFLEHFVATEVNDRYVFMADFSSKTAAYNWLKNHIFKICLQVDSEEQLLELYEKAKERGLPCTLITDIGHTVFNGTPTNTCVGIGPVFDGDVDDLTQELKLY